ncbi:PepSY-associated TM helix domain-containing protein [Allosphingosinicella humi]
MGKRLRALHRWLSIAMLGFWFVQAVTGVMLVFSWELDDATISARHVPTDIAAIERRIASLKAANPGAEVPAFRATAGAPDRYDIDLLKTPGEPLTVVRVDGAGEVLRTRSGDALMKRGSIFDLAFSVHETLLSGDRGSWLVGISGLLLLSNLLLGLKLAWPKGGRWRRALRPAATPSPVARVHGWHRAIGLWGVFPAIVSVACGTALIFVAGLGALLGVEERAPVASAWAGEPIPMSAAVARAASLFPGASLARVQFPTPDEPYYFVALRQAGEAARVYGSTSVAVAADGKVIDVVDPFRMSAAERALDLLYPIHTGEIGGAAGRLLILFIGLWLATMIILGSVLWIRRRHARK